MPQVMMRYWAAAKEAAGMAEETVSASTLSEALEIIQALRFGDTRFADVLLRSSFLVDEMQVGKRDPMDIALSDGAVIEVLPAFAGG